MAPPKAKYLGSLSPDGTQIHVRDVDDRKQPIGPWYAVEIAHLNNPDSIKVAAALNIPNLRTGRCLSLEGRREVIAETIVNGATFSPRNAHVFDTGALIPEPAWSDDPLPEPEPEPAPIPEPEPAPKVTLGNQNGQPADKLRDAMLDLLGSTVNEDQVRAIAQSVAEAVAAEYLRPNVIRVELPDQETREVSDRQHFKFPELLTTIGSGVDPWLYGPAGSGKTSAFRAACMALGRGATVISCSPDMGIHEFVGFIDAKGDYAEPPFVLAIKQGHGILLDEGDTLDRNTFVRLQDAFASRVIMTPVGALDIPEGCFFAVAANTVGTGGTRAYAAGELQSFAARDRFVFLDWPYDEDLELEMALSVLDPAQAKSWHSRVKRARAAVESHGLDYVVSPRATLYGAKLLRAGMTQSRVEEMTIRKGMPADHWAKVSA